jgi:hypothetical protein
METTTAEITNQIGAAIKQYLKEEQDILLLSEQEAGATHPEHIGALHAKLHELRQQHTQTKIALRNLKEAHKRQLVKRLEHINLELDSSVRGLDDSELTDLRDEVEKKIAAIEAEIKTVYAA